MQRKCCAVCGELCPAERVQGVSCKDEDMTFRRRLRALVFPDEKADKVPEGAKALMEGIALEQAGVRNNGMIMDTCRTCWISVAQHFKLPKRGLCAGLNFGTAPKELPKELRDFEREPLLRLFDVTSWDLPEPTLPEQAVISLARIKFSVLRCERAVAGAKQRYSRGHCMMFPVVIDGL